MEFQFKKNKLFLTDNGSVKELPTTVGQRVAIEGKEHDTIYHFLWEGIEYTHLPQEDIKERAITCVLDDGRKFFIEYCELDERVMGFDDDEDDWDDEWDDSDYDDDEDDEITW